MSFPNYLTPNLVQYLHYQDAKTLSKIQSFENCEKYSGKIIVRGCEDFDINSIERQFTTFETRRERICDLHTQTILRNSQELESDSDSD